MTIRVDIDGLYREFVPKLLSDVWKDPRIAGRLDEYSCPFVPYVGTNYEDCQTRIVIVGKATNGWGCGKYRTLADCTAGTARDVEDCLCRLSTEFVARDYVIPYFSGETVAERHKKYQSPFWRRIYRLVPAILQRTYNVSAAKCREAAEECFNSIAWTNVFKIALDGGNPDPDMIRFLSGETFLPLLRNELEILRPHAVLFSTGPGYDHYLKEMSLPVTEESRSISRVEGAVADVVAFRTYHFQYGKFKSEELIGRILAGLDGSSADRPC